MVLVLTIAGLVALAAGLLAVMAGLPIMEFSYGNTLIISGAFGAGCGLIVIGLAQILRELRRQAASGHHVAGATRTESPYPVPPAAAMPSVESPFATPHATAASGGAAPDTASWQEAPPLRHDMRRAKAEDGYETPAGRPSSRFVTPSPRNLMFRRPAHPVTMQDADAEPNGMAAPVSTAPAEPIEETPALQRVEGLWKRRRKQPAVAAEPSPTLDLSSAGPSAESTSTVLKSGTVDGLAYTLYSDGSIEAQLPEGTVRFDSIGALRLYLDRPA